MQNNKDKPIVLQTARFLLLLFGLYCLAILPAAQAEPKLPSEAIVTGDHVRIRTDPSLKGKHMGYLFKNMVVKVNEKSANTTKVGKENHHWYKIEQGHLKGWAYGKFISFTVPSGSIDTYDSSMGMEWFYKRFGYSTWFEYAKPTVGIFSIDEYRSLMKAASEGNETAMPALSRTIYQHLKKKPNDPKYRYLQRKLYSKDFLLAAYTKNPYAMYTSYEYLPSKLQRDKKLFIQVIARTDKYIDLYSLPEKLRNNKEVVLAALIKHPNNNWYGQAIPAALWKDKKFAIKAMAINCQWGSAISADSAYLEQVAKKAGCELAQ